MSELTLVDLLEWTGRAPTERNITTITESKAMATGRAKSAATPPAAFWPGAARGISRALGDALQVTVHDVLVGGWNAYRSVNEYADPAKHAPTEIAQVALGRHTITSSHTPRVELQVNGHTIATVEFEVALELEIESAILTIQNVRIMEVSLGRCTAKGTLSCEGAELVKRESREIKLPGRIGFGAGIPIAKRASEGQR